MTGKSLSACFVVMGLVGVRAATVAQSPQSPAPAAPPAPAAVAPSGVEPEPFDDRISSRFDAYIADVLRRAEVPGAAVVVVQDGRTVYAKGFGVRELGKPEPVTPETLMMIGSTGKSMTALMMATLVDDGKITWDTPLARIDPSFTVSDPALTQQVTFRTAACNCSGIERHDLEMFFAGDLLTAEEVVRSIRAFPLVGEFGKTFGYVNQLFGAGGYIAARAARGAGDDLYASYVTQMQQRVFDPIGMTSTTFAIDRAGAAPDHATPHGATAAGEYVPISPELERPLAAIAPAGASWSNALDMARYLMTQLNRGVTPDGKRVVSAESLAATWQPQVEIQPGASYGLGWVITTYKGQPLLSHGGGTAGFTSDLTFLPDAKLGIAVLTNAQNASLFCIAVRSRALELAFGQPTVTDAAISSRLEQAERRLRDKTAGLRPVDPTAVSPYLGSYTNKALGKVTLSLTGTKLTFAAGGFASELRSTGDDTWVLWDPPLAGALIRFSKDEHGWPAFVLDADDPDVPETYRFLKEGGAPLTAAPPGSAGVSPARVPAT